MADDTAATGSGVSIAIEDPTSEDASELIRQLSAELAVRYDFADDGSGLFSAADVQSPRAAFLVLRLDGRPVGCGALRPMDEEGFEDAAEIKRMYVAQEMRGRRLAAVILERLEQLLRQAQARASPCCWRAFAPISCAALDRLGWGEWLPRERWFPEEETDFSATLRAIRKAYELVDAGAANRSGRLLPGVACPGPPIQVMLHARPQAGTQPPRRGQHHVRGARTARPFA